MVLANDRYGGLDITSRVIATCFALTSFAGALFVGLAADNPLQTILLRALFTMVVCYAIGLVIGSVAEHAIAKHIEQHKRDRPIPEDFRASDLGEEPGTATHPSS